MKKIFSLFLVLALLSGCSGSTVKRTQSLLGTTVEITVVDRDKPRRAIDRSIEKAFREIERIEQLLSRFRPGSDISRINVDAYLEPQKVALETIALIEKAIRFSQLSEGAFDITLERAGYRNIKILKQKQRVSFAKREMKLDLGGIAKGYAVDRAIEVLKQEGIKCALVNAGGDIYGLGSRDRNSNWQVGLQHPRKKDVILAVLELEDRACATSGDYECPDHIVNPKTGYPPQDTPASVTVLAKDCLSADALATSVFVLGPTKGINLINQLEDTEAIVISIKEDARLDVLFSRGLKGKVKLNSE